MVQENEVLIVDQFTGRVNPRGAVVDPERQLQRQVAALRGGGGGGSFTALLAPLAEGIGAKAGLQLASLTYSQSRGELRINLLAPDFSAVERLQAALSAQGVQASLENSSRSGDQVRARLRIGGDSCRSGSCASACVSRSLCWCWVLRLPPTFW